MVRIRRSVYQNDTDPETARNIYISYLTFIGTVPVLPYNFDMNVIILKAAVGGLKRDERQEIDRNLESLGITPVAAVVDTIASLPPSLSGNQAYSLPYSTSSPYREKFIYIPAVLRIQDILGWIRIHGSIPLTNGSGSGSWIRILLFSSLTFKMPAKTNFLTQFFLLITF